MMFSTSPSIGVHLCVTVQNLHYISDERSWMEARLHKRKLLSSQMLFAQTDREKTDYAES